MEHLMLTMLLFMMDHCHLVDIHKAHSPCNYNYNIELPKVKFLSQNDLQEYHYAGTNVPKSHRLTLKALYDYDTKTILLLKTWNKHNRWDLSDLVHELYHHAQWTNNPSQEYTCMAYTEIPAYQMQLTYLKYKHKQPAFSDHADTFKNMGCNTLYK